MALVKIVQHRSVQDRCEIVLRAAASDLRSHVTGYCGYQEIASRLNRRVNVASSTVGLIIGFGDPVGISYPRSRARPIADLSGSVTRVTSFVAGLHDSYALTESTGYQHGIQIDLTPLGAYMLFGVSMVDLSHRVVDLGAIAPGLWSRLDEELHGMPSWQARFDRLDAFITGRLAVARKPSRGIGWACRRLHETCGRMPIAALADELGWSRPLLVKKFREEVGVPPKTLARILRFQRAAGVLDRQGPKSGVTARPGKNERRLTDVAHDCGYYDQAHFDRDFREFTGCTPTEFLARRHWDGSGVLPDGR
jgi:AraC-like DNA-binding protein